MTEQTPKRNTRRDPEGGLALTLVGMAALELLLVVVLLLRAFAPAVRPPEVLPPTPVTTAPTTPTPDPVPATPVFAGGVIPALPRDTSNTQTLTGAAVASNYALLFNARTGEVIVGKNADTPFSPASLTKVMTLIVACEALTEEELSTRLTLTEEVTEYVTSGSYADTGVALIDGDKYLNDEFTIRDLLFGIGVASGADCTYMIVKHVAGDEASFVARMNQKAEELGLTKTHFDNAVGYDSQTNVTTAREMALIMQYALQCDLIREILSVESHVFYGYYLKDGVEDSYRRTVYSTLFRDRMDTYKKYVKTDFALTTARLTGGKTGYWNSSHIVVTAKGNTSGDEYILVLGDAVKTETLPASVYTMKDIKLLLDTYAQ